MKYAVVLSALATVAMAAQPKILNNDFVVKEGESFTLKFINCQSGCTISLQNGPPTNTKDVKVLTSAATGDSFTFTPSDVGSGTYNFKITSNADPAESNYSKQFVYTGTGSTSAATSGAGTTAPSASSASGSSTASSTDSSIRSATESTSMTTLTNSSSASTTSAPSTTTSAPSTTTSERSTSTRTTANATTTIPNAGGRASPLALVAGAVAVLAYFG
ncbi:hypothetical protein EsDP_00003961 [Epichloe bromicola]|uniref:Extracellular matrix protein n=1 Tax=Epichloe bromicola TaxID=79588 RepID=A0ABQ0CQA7_9HYPO